MIILNSQIRNTFKDVKKRMNYEGKVFLLKDLPLYTGINGNGGFMMIILTRDFLKLAKNKINQPLSYYLLGHELSHIIFRDYGSKVLKRKKLMKSPDQVQAAKATAMHILMELRADLKSALIFPFDRRQLTLAHIQMEESNYNEWLRSDPMDRYKKGYPTRLDRIRYSLYCYRLQKKQQISRLLIENKIIKPLLTRYLSMVEIPASDQHKIINDVISQFWEDSGNNFI